MIRASAGVVLGLFGSDALDGTEHVHQLVNGPRAHVGINGWTLGEGGVNPYQSPVYIGKRASGSRLWLTSRGTLHVTPPQSL
jgi:hypothetical protein